MKPVERQRQRYNQALSLSVSNENKQSILLLQNMHPVRPLCMARDLACATRRKLAAGVKWARLRTFHVVSFSSCPVLLTRELSGLGF